MAAPGMAAPGMAAPGMAAPGVAAPGVAALPLPRLPLPRPRRYETRTLPEGALVWRVYRAGGRHPATWSTFRRYGPVANGRFDHQEPPPHDDPERGMLYGSLDAPAAIAEAFQDGRLIDRVRDAPWLVCFALGRATSVLDLRGAWPTRAGASQAIASGPRDVAQAWSREIYAAYPSVEGLLYRSAMAGSATNVALYERAAAGLPAHPELHVPLGHPGLDRALSRIADRFGYDLR